MRCVVSWGSASFPWLVFFFGALLWGSIMHNLVSQIGVLSPVNHKGLHQGWPQTSHYFQVIHFTSDHTTSHVYWAYLYSAGTQHGNLHTAGWTILFCGPTREPVLATANRGKKWEEVEKNAGGWTGRVEIIKEEIPGSKRGMYGYIPTYSRI